MVKKKTKENVKVTLARLKLKTQREKASIQARKEFRKEERKRVSEKEKQRAKVRAIVDKALSKKLQSKRLLRKTSQPTLVLKEREETPSPFINSVIQEERNLFNI